VRFLTPVRLIAAGLVLCVVAFALWVLPSKQYIFLPDRAHAVAPLVTVDGGKDPTDGGGIYFVDVIVRKASLLERMFGGLHEGADLYNPSQLFPPGVSSGEQQRVDMEDMRHSQRVAAAVALRALGQKVQAVPNGALISGIQDGMPADGTLEPTDVIVAVDGTPVRTPEDVSRLMLAKRPGSKVRFTLRRGKARKVVALKTVASAGSHRAVVGVFLEQATDIRLPRDVAIDTHGVGGPSAGLAFALDVMEELGRNVDGGHKIAATGELFLDGKVGPIGGIKQKTIGARRAGVDAFLVPAGNNAREALKYADGLRIIPVKSFQQALRALRTLPESQ
jgi:Lon-like protease